MKDPAQLWADPRLVYSVAAAAVALLLITLWLFGRRKRQGRQAAVVCLMVSIVLHAALIFLVPLLPKKNGGTASPDPDSQQPPGAGTIELSHFDPDVSVADASGTEQHASIAPLPVSDLTDLLKQPPPPVPTEVTPSDVAEDTPPIESTQKVPDSLTPTPEESSTEIASLDSELGQMLAEALVATEPAPMAADVEAAANVQPQSPSVPQSSSTPSAIEATPVAQSTAPEAMVPGALESDFANRVGGAKELALLQTGGNARTEAAVEAALRFLADAQRADGAWDPIASGGGRENRQVLAVARPGTGSRAESAITGLALLTMIGTGHTHLQGDYADNVYRGLAYLIRTQQPDGSLAGEAMPYAANYAHGMAALAMCETAAITKDPSSIQCARRAIRYTLAQQHPTTGGWRYIPGDPGDLSQLGWQAMVLDAGHRAQIPIDNRAVAGIQRFLLTVRKGQTGGLASYRPDEPPSRTMTAEALATRLLIGQQVPQAELDEAQRYLLQQPPGVGQDNYYYWYYATLGLHQLQNDAWQQWNQALQQRLLATQRPDGSWSSDTMWGRYGGTVYTTSMAALCLETYYRHAIRNNHDRIATRPVGQRIER